MEFKISPLIHFHTTTCCECGVVFCLTDDIWNTRKKDRSSFFCPNGHGQYFSGKSQEQILKEQLQQKEQELLRERTLRNEAEAKLRQRRKRRKTAV